MNVLFRMVDETLVTFAPNQGEMPGDKGVRNTSKPHGHAMHVAPGLAAPGGPPCQWGAPVRLVDMGTQGAFDRRDLRQRDPQRVVFPHDPNGDTSVEINPLRAIQIFDHTLANTG